MTCAHRKYFNLLSGYCHGILQTTYKLWCSLSLTEKHLSEAIRKCPKRAHLAEAIFTSKHEKPFLLPGAGKNYYERR